MADEFSITVSAQHQTGSGTDTISTVRARLDSTDSITKRGQTLSTTPETVAFPSASGRIGAVISNLGDTNNILVSLDAAAYPLIVPPLATIPFLLVSPTADITIKAAAATTTYDVLAA